MHPRRRANAASEQGGAQTEGEFVAFSTGTPAPESEYVVTKMFGHEGVLYTPDNAALVADLPKDVIERHIALGDITRRVPKESAQ